MLKNTLNAKHKLAAVMNRSDSLSLFGYGATFRIYEPKNGRKSVTNFDYASYELPPGCNKKKAKSYLAGSNEFKIKEIEVFLITFK